MRRVSLILSMLVFHHLLIAQDFLALVRKNGEQYFIDRSSKVIRCPKADKVRSFSDGLARIKIDGMWANYMNKNGSLTITLPYGHAEDFSEGYAAVAVDGAWGYINKTGKLVIRPNFEEVGIFSEGLARAKLNRSWGFIDTTGRWVIKPKPLAETGYDFVMNFKEGKARVRKSNMQDFTKIRWGYIDKAGKVVIPVALYKAEDFCDSLARVKNGGDWVYTDHDKKGKIKIKCDDARDFSEGLAAVKQGERWGYVNTKGDWIIPPTYNEAKEFKNGLAPVQNNKKLWGYIDSQGQWLITPQFDEAESFARAD